MKILCIIVLFAFAYPPAAEALRRQLSPGHTTIDNKILSSEVPLPVELMSGGSNSKPGKWPWMVSLQFKNEHLCGGVLISPNWVLTAAHCITVPNKPVTHIVLGEYNLAVQDPGQITVRVKNNYTHRDYKPKSSKVADIALIELSEAVRYTSYIRPACLPSGRVSKGQQCVVAGWGRTSNAEQFTNILHEANVEVYGKEICKTKYSDYPVYKYVDLAMICAGSQVSDVCQGDSGGPLMCKVRNKGPWVVYGVVSYGWGDCGGTEDPGVYTDVFVMVDWIKGFKLYFIKG